MTEANATQATEAPPAPAPPSDVEMESAEDAPINRESASFAASDATSANGREEAEQHAPTPAPAKEVKKEDETTQQTAEAASAAPTASSDDGHAAANLASAEPEAPRSDTAPAGETTSDVKPEHEEAASLKRNEPSSASATDNGEVSTAPVPADTPNGTSPAAKRLKVATKPSSETAAASPAPLAVAVAAEAVSAPLMMSRDDMAKLEEDSGLLKFDVITNDGRADHMVQLTTLKNIFARQLPKMPREYIVRLVFDRNHRSMVILKNGKQVIGGICYRPFEPNHFAEIAFCAINAADQVKGYGTRLMNHLKEFVKASGITHFLTYADNYAIGYFKKQGFAKVVSMPRPNWFGYIKDYDGGTLMECTIHHQINYLRITSMVHQQRKKIQDKIKERSHADIVYPGITRFAEGRTMDLYMIPGVQEAGWSRAVIRNSRVGTRDQGSLKTQLQQLWKLVQSHRSAWPFHEPVDTDLVVDYLDYIKEPVDLTLIHKRIESGHYLSKAAFKDDLDKMCANCMLYNTPDTNYYKAAEDLKKFIDKQVPVAK